MDATEHRYQIQTPAVGRFYQRHFALFFMPAALLDADGRVVHWNHHAEAVSGRPCADMAGSRELAVLFGERAARPAAALRLFLAGDGAGLEAVFGASHLIRDRRGNLAVLDCGPEGGADPRLLLVGRWRDDADGRNYVYAGWDRLGAYDFAVSPSVPLYEVLQALDRKRPAWFGVQQDERYCYLSPDMINALYGAGLSMETLLGAPLGQTMAAAVAADHARTIASLDARTSPDTMLNWPHPNAAHLSWMQSFPRMLPVNGRMVNFSLVRDISAQKERDASLENLLVSYKIGAGDKDVREWLSDFAGVSRAMREALANIVRAALSLVTVSIHGETGTGKSQVARLMHRLSSRAAGPFVYVNCGAIPDALFESHFFGHVKGSFTGAVRDAEGLLTRADQGTLFLDEIAELSPRAQAKLLQALSDKSYTPVGSTRELGSKFRLIAATNRDLADMVRRGSFREDLYYRINVMEVRLPPLRARREDIPLLVDSILRRHDIAVKPASRDLRLLEEHGWPGNIRELENVLLRYAAEGNLDFFRPASVPEPVAPGPVEPSGGGESGGTLRELMARHEKEILTRCLARNRWRRGRAAAELGVSRPTLFRKMREHGLLEEEKGEEDGGCSPPIPSAGA